MSSIQICGMCGYLSGSKSKDDFQECLCFRPPTCAESRYRRILNNWSKNRERRNYEPDDFDPPDAA